MHWKRWRHGDPLKVLQPGVDFMVKATCSVEGCGRPVHAHSFCPKHLSRWEKHGDPHHVPRITGRPWKGAQPTFGAVHRRIRRSLGRAAARLCVDCLDVAAEWSYDGTDPNPLLEVLTPGGLPIAYSTDPDRYVPRCVPCHRRHDAAQRAVTRKEALL